jgi:trk system potassium uptake protein TrkH
MRDYHLSFYIAGLFGCIFSSLMLIPMLVEYYYVGGNENFDIFANSAMFGLFTSILMMATSYTKQGSISRSSSFLATVLTWFYITFLSAIPLYFAYYPNYSITIIDALFESSSGITTTGATILYNLHDVSKGILLWRAMLHFLGGIGVITLVFIVLPYLQNGSMYFFLTESSENQEKETPRILDFAMLIVMIYSAFAIVCACVYYFLGMSGFDAICHAMSTVSSGGFGNYDSSFLVFKSYKIEVAAIFFMFLAAMPFIIIIRIFTRRKFSFNGQTMAMLYFTSILFALLCFVYFVIQKMPFSYAELRHLLFALISIQSSTGFFSANLSYYGQFLIAILIIAGIVGGCTGSTSGGIKIFRIQIVLAMIKHHFLKITYPNLKMKVRCDGQEVSQQTVSSIVVLISIYMASLMFITLFMVANNFEFSESIATGVSFLSNAGSIATEYGQSTSIISTFSQTLRGICAFAMLLGRLEFVAIIVIVMKIFQAR